MPQSPVRRPAAVSRPHQSNRRPSNPGARAAAGRPGPARPAGARGPGGPGKNGRPEPADHEILFQQYFKSVGPRTYAAQVKRANNGNHYLVMTEGKRDESTGEVRKTRLFVFSEDFVELFRMLQATAQFIRANPVPDEVKKKRDRHWTKKAGGATGAVKPNPDVQPTPHKPQARSE